jgi:outer membrane lipoprotein SlyB
MKCNAIILSAATLALAGCATNPQAQAPVYQVGATYTMAESKVVTVESVRSVMVKKRASGAWQQIAGTGIGGVIGGVAGSTVGKGKGQQLAAIVGATFGAAAGNATADAMATVPGYEITVSYMNGKEEVAKTIVQDSEFGTPKPGQRARLTLGAGGARVIPL